MVVRPLALLAAAAAVLWALPAPAADPPRALRTLSYRTAVSVNAKITENVSGFSGMGGGAGQTHVDRSSTQADAGIVTFDVIAATPDGGLVVDATYTGDNSGLPRTRIAVYADGRLGADPSLALPAAVTYLLPLLARGFVAGREIAVGTTWAVHPAAPATGATNYTVRAIDGGTIALGFDEKLTLPGARGFDTSGSGSAQYDTDTLKPTSVTVDEFSHHQPEPTQYVESQTHFTATLISDTFTKR